MRAARRLLIVLVVLLGLFVAADRVAVNLAEGEVASRVQSSEGLSQKPSVSIAGFPFLTQLIGSKLDELTVKAGTLTVNGTSTGLNSQLRLQNFTADLKGVAMSNNYSSAVADTATGSALISYQDLSAVLPNHPTVAYGGAPGKVKVAGTVDLPIVGAQQVSGTADVSVASGGAISLTGLTGVSGVDPSVAGLVTSFLQPRFTLSGLPHGLSLQSVQSQPEGVSIAVSGTGVSLSN
ncbi:DUF2993 domain-containing protein [Streptacidiphilus sp. EB129]|uniref:LmeA family phospholipid-binding protein n=1 Tax=Streptacidiphilus sp. EB129 TaxID=3156262 RepID=UPI003513AD72